MAAGKRKFLLQERWVEKGQRMDIQPNVDYCGGLKEDILMEEEVALDLIRELCEELNSNQIVYCHWKSNAALDRSASGDNDLDLLVLREDVQKFTEILDRLGFKQAHEPVGHEMPGVLDYYGYSREADKLVHAQYRKPWSLPYMRSA